MFTNMLVSCVSKFLKVENKFIIFVIFAYIRVTIGNDVASDKNVQDIFDKQTNECAVIANLRRERNRLLSLVEQCSTETAALQLALDTCNEDNLENENTEHAHLQTRIACESSTLDIKCNGNQVINIVSANYGRKEPGSTVCPHNSIRTVNCFSNNSKSIVTSQCQKKSSCSVWASNSIFSDPCVHTYKYLEVVYECQ